MMQEFVKKLIERLEEEHERCINRYGIVGGNAPASAVQRCIRAVEEIAGEYNNGWIPCSERLPEERFYDDGYVEPSEEVLVFTKYGDCKVSRYWGNRRNQRDYYDWVDIKYRQDKVIAWRELPAPYQPKGE